MVEDLPRTNFGLDLYYLAINKKLSKMFIHYIHKKNLHTPKALSKVSAGFTLVELAVVIAIIGILVTLTSVSFGTQNTKKALEVNAREISSVFREAQNYALTGKQLNSSNTTCAYSVTWVASTSTYSLNAIPKNGATCNGTPTIIVTYLLKQGVTFTGSGSVSFSLPWGTSSGAVKVLLSRLGDVATYYHTVCLNASGTVVDQVGNITCP